MRAVLLESIQIEGLEPQKLITVMGTSFHHLKRVARINLGEDVLVLNGKGEKIFTKVTLVDNKSLQLRIESWQKCTRDVFIDLALCLPKKEAVEDIIRMGVEIGINKIIPIITEYSSRDFTAIPRTKRIIESAMLQSNNPFGIEISPAVNFGEIKSFMKDDQDIYYFTSNIGRNNLSSTGCASKGKGLIIIGPEGGLSPREESLLETMAVIKKNTPAIVYIALVYCCGGGRRPYH